MVEKSSGMKVKVLRTDIGGKYTSEEFKQHLKKQGTQHELTVPKTPQQMDLQNAWTEHLWNPLDQC